MSLWKIYYFVQFIPEYRFTRKYLELWDTRLM